MVTAKLTADALGGSLSAAFTAMDALPYVSAVSTGLGVITARCLLLALAGIAEALSLADVAERARTAMRVAVGGGAVAGTLQLAMKSIPAELLLAAAVLVVPALLFAAVQLLRVMLAIVETIRERTTASP